MSGAARCYQSDMMAILPSHLLSHVAIRIHPLMVNREASRAGRHGLFWDQMGAGLRFFNQHANSRQRNNHAVFLD